jgi:hypothetical protein
MRASWWPSVRSTRPVEHRGHAEWPRAGMGAWVSYVVPLHSRGACSGREARARRGLMRPPARRPACCIPRRNRGANRGRQVQERAAREQARVRRRLGLNRWRVSVVDWGRRSKPHGKPRSAVFVRGLLSRAAARTAHRGANGLEAWKLRTQPLKGGRPETRTTAADLQAQHMDLGTTLWPRLCLPACHAELAPRSGSCRGQVGRLQRLP